MLSNIKYFVEFARLKFPTCRDKMTVYINEASILPFLVHLSTHTTPHLKESVHKVHILLLEILGQKPIASDTPAISLNNLVGRQNSIDSADFFAVPEENTAISTIESAENLAVAVAGSNTAIEMLTVRDAKVWNH